MNSYVSGVLRLIGLYALGMVAAALGTDALVLFLVATILVPFLSLFKLMPKLGLTSRGFAVAVIFFIGLPTIHVYQTAAAERDTKELAELKISDPVAYMVELKSKDEDKYLEELAVLDPERHAIEAADKAARDAEAAAQKAAARAAAKEEAEIAAREKVSEYLVMLDQGIEGIADLKASNFTEDVLAIVMGLTLIDRYNEYYENGLSLPLDDAGLAKREQYASALRRKQSEMLPVLRDAYGPAMRAQLWEADGWAQTKGNGFRTVTIVNAIFAANSNIKDIHETLRDQLNMLRFTRAEYKWYKEARDFSYYPLEVPSDNQLGRWGRNGSFSPL